MSLTHDSTEDVSLLPVFRAMAECYTRVERIANRHIEALGLTGAQFDVIATLGDTAGMTCKELGERTLITKGTLTPVLNRLEERGLIKREKGTRDSRQVYISLTSAGDKVYHDTFMPHVTFMKRYIDRMPQAHQQQLIERLNELKALFEEDREPSGSCGE